MAEPADDKDNARKLAPVGAIFVGMVAARNLARRGDDRPLKALEHAERLRKSGAGESQIYTETNKMFEGSPYAGVSYGADRKPRFEISDHSSELRTAALDPKGKGLQGNFLRHPDYYAAHPEAAHLDVFKHGTSGGGYGGGAVFVGDSHFAKTKLLGRPVANPTARGVNLHELQHHAQEAEGFAPGGSPKDFENRLPGERNAQMRRALYDRLAGEVEAENTRKRANMTPIERRAIHPTRTASIPRSEQVVTDQHGTVQEIFDPKSIKVTKLATGAAIKFDYDRETVADFKKSFPKAKWSQDTKTWHVPGKLAGNRADRWLAAQQDTAGKLAKADAIARDAVAFDGAPKSKYVQSLPVGYSVRTGYDPNIVKALKAIPGSSWDARHKIWMVPHRSANELKAALPTIEPLADKIAAAEKAQQDKLAAEKESQRKQWAAERAASTAARDTEMAKVRASRIAVHRSDNVKVGDAVMLMGKVAVVESFGREFRADDSFPSVHGSRWLGHEGERARYAYTREATPAETAAFNAKEAAAKAAQERITQLASSVRAARAQVDGKFNNAATPKKLAQLPAGETLAHFGKQNAAYGGGTEFRLSVDGKTIWRIQGNGADGDNWSANNAPGSIASKVRATKELVSKLRALGEVEGSGLRGTQNPENLKSILDGRKNKASANPAAPVAPVRIQEMAEDIKDFGEKIGGSRKDRAVKTAAKLEAVAKRTIAEAQAVHDQPRLMNTARRARMGSGVMEEQQRKIANAKTALKIAEALRNGEAGALVKVESLADVERLSSAHRSAMYANKAKREEHRGSMTGVEPDRADIAHAKPAEMVRANISPSDIPRMKKALAGKGVARDLARLEKIASEKDGWRLTDPRDIESLGKVAKAIKTLDPKDTSWTEHKWQARSLQSDANRWMGEVREFQAKQRLGLTDAGELRATLEAFADARVNRKAADPVALAERDLIGRKLPGFFPTPQTLAERMAQMAEIKPGMQVLEPSAGTGRLADAAKKLGAQVDAVEMQSSLRDILLKKGHNVVEHDFTSMKAEPKYDRIVMNPPFEKGQDIAHVRQAYDMLKPGGKMVAVMGEGAFFRGDTKASEFRNWLETVGTSEKLPEGTFKESNTGVNTRLVTITKPAEASSAVKNENRGWSDAARAASADARGVAKPGEAKPKPSPTVQSAVERAMAMQEAKAKTSAPSTLAAPKPVEAAPTPANMSGSGSKRYVTLGDGRKVTLGQYTEAWKLAKSLPPSTKVRGSPDATFRDAPNTAGDAVQEFRRALNDRINQKTPGFEQGRKWDATWQSDARRLAETMARKSEVPAGEAHPVDLRNKVADRLAPSTKLPPKGGTGIKGKVMGLMAPVAIGSAALIAMNESAKAGETTGQQVKAGSIEAVKGGAVMGGFVAGTIAITKGLTKAGLTAAKAVPATQAILMAGGAIHGAVTAKPGERMKGAAKGAWDMSVPGMVVNTYEAGKAAYHSTADRLSSPSRMTTEQAQHFNQANAAYKADHQSGPITVEQFERTRRLPSGAVVTETVSTHTRARRD